ncbi:MAG: hypothetical protein MZV64_12740 [Ignavibacteriales bacterium]|nr:hypothetical protein [Ignavibacteriales bacterium]
MERTRAALAYGVETSGNFAEPGKSRDGRNILHSVRATGAPGDRVDESRRKLSPRPREAGPAVQGHQGPRRLERPDDRRPGIGLRAHRRGPSPAPPRRGRPTSSSERMRARDGRLLHVYAAGEARIPAFLDDYAFFIKGLIALYEAAFDPDRLEAAIELARQAIELFWDGEEGGFFFAAAPEAGPRRKEIYDGAVPSGNSVMLTNLLRLGRLSGRQELEDQGFEAGGGLLTRGLPTSARPRGIPAADWITLWARRRRSSSSEVGGPRKRGSFSPRSAGCTSRIRPFSLSRRTIRPQREPSNASPPLRRK